MQTADSRSEGAISCLLADKATRCCEAAVDSGDAVETAKADTVKGAESVDVKQRLNQLVGSLCSMRKDAGRTRGGRLSC